MNLKDKIIQNKVVLDLNPDLGSFTGVPQYVSLDLHKDGEWFCSYLGFVDEHQVEQLRSVYEIQENAVDPTMAELNRHLRGDSDSSASQPNGSVAPTS
jgi:hypothetical protein